MNGTMTVSFEPKKSLTAFRSFTAAPWVAHLSTGVSVRAARAVSGVGMRRGSLQSGTRFPVFCPRLPASVLALLAAGLFSACQAGPARPSVSFAAPALASPAAGAVYNFTDQPVSVTFANAVRSGTAVVTYSVEVATAASFAGNVVAASDIAEGTGGVTSVRLPVLGGNTTYYWRTRATVDGITGEPSPTSTFVVRPAVVLQPPGPVTPSSGGVTGLARPTFTVDNAVRTGPAGVLTYEFQVSTSAAFGTLAASASVGEQPTQTSWTPTVDLPEGALFWRARALDPASGAVGTFSTTVSFERRRFGAPGDQIDLSAVTVVLGPQNIGTWPATGTVTSTVAQPFQLCIDHDKLGSWPGAEFFEDPGTLTQGNQWMFAFIGGRWYGGAGRWSRVGQACKSTTGAADFFGGTFYMDAAEPLRSYVPRTGDVIGLMFSTPARFYPGMRTVDERTNVVLVPFGP